MPYGWSGLISLVYFAVVIVVALAIARLLLIHTVRIIRREWTRPEPPRD
ncbi:MAG: hypothetical protein ACXWQR_06550 [Ktedonobacterales bacterium]